MSLSFALALALCATIAAGCQSGYGGTPCAPCPIGTYSDATATTCVSCPLGFTSASASTSLTACTVVASYPGAIPLNTPFGGILPAGVYISTGAAATSSPVSLDCSNSPNSFLFIIEGVLSFNNDVTFLNGPCAVQWSVGGAASLATGVTVAGNLNSIGLISLAANSHLLGTATGMPVSIGPGATVGSGAPSFNYGALSVTAGSSFTAAPTMLSGLPLTFSIMCTPTTSISIDPATGVLSWNVPSTAPAGSTDCTVTATNSAASTPLLIHIQVSAAASPSTQCSALPASSGTCNPASHIVSASTTSTCLCLQPPSGSC